MISRRSLLSLAAGAVIAPRAEGVRQFVLKEVDIRGSRNALPEDFADTIRMLEARRFPVESAVGLTTGFASSARER